MKTLLALAASLLLFAVPALAQAPQIIVAAPPAGTVLRDAVDWTPIVQTVVLTLVSAVVTYFVLPALKNASDWLFEKAKAAGIEVDDARRAAWDRAMQLSLQAAVEKTAGVTAEMIVTGRIPPGLKDEFLRNGAAYAKEHFLDISRGVGVDPAIQTGVITVMNALEARMGGAQITAATSPVPAAAASSPTMAPTAG